MDEAHKHNIEKKESHKRTYTVDSIYIISRYKYIYIYGKTEVKKVNDQKKKRGKKQRAMVISIRERRYKQK